MKLHTAYLMQNSNIVSTSQRANAMYCTSVDPKLIPNLLFDNI